MTRRITNASFVLRMTGTMQNLLDDGTGPTVTHPSLQYQKDMSVMSSGVDNNQFNRVWQSEDRTILSGVTETLDMYDLAAVNIGAGAGLDGLGQAVDFEEIVGIAIINENAAGADGALEITPNAGNGWTALGSHTVATGGALYGQSVFCKFQPDRRGFDVTDAANHLLDLTANGGDVVYSIYLMARNDDEESSSSSSSSSASSSSSSVSSSSSSPSSESSSSVSSSSSSSVTSSSHSSKSSSSSGTSSSSSSSGTSSSSSISSSSWSS